MKMQSNNFLSQLNGREINNLTEQVKETLAANVETVISKNTFTAADFWNIQRMRKARVLRRGIM
jgi:hypothetical protein